MSSPKPRGLTSDGEASRVDGHHACSIETTLDTYGHLFDGLDEAAADRLDEVRRGSRAQQVMNRVNVDTVVRLKDS